jgi:hypothetical protein
VVHGGPQPRAAAEARESTSSPAFPCVGPHHGGTGSKRRGRGSLPRLAQDGGGAHTTGCRRREAAAERAQREGARGAEVRGGGEQRAWCGEAEARAPFIGQDGERRGREAGGRRWSLTLRISLLKREGESTR